MAGQIFAEQFAIGERTGDYNCSVTMELELYRKDGSTFMCEVTAALLVEENDRQTIFPISRVPPSI